MNGSGAVSAFLGSCWPNEKGYILLCKMENWIKCAVVFSDVQFILQ